MGTTEIVVNDRIRRGLEALAEKHGYAEVIAEADDTPHLFVDMGVFDLTEYPYDQDEARVILRIHQDFPQGRHYGLATVPVLTVDGRKPDSAHVNKPKAEAIRQAGIRVDYLFWSRDWQEMTVSQATDMAKATAFVRGTLMNPFDE